MAEPAQNPLRQLLGYQLRRASAAAMEELARELATVDMRITEASVLLLAGGSPQLRSSEIGRELGIQRANMTPLVTGLEQRGLLIREPVDGRSHRLRLTERGEQMRARALRLMQAHDQRLRSRLGEGGPRGLMAALERVWTPSAEPCGEATLQGAAHHAAPAPVQAQKRYLAEK